jgi:hypothetical protein
MAFCEVCDVLEIQSGQIMPSEAYVRTRCNALVTGSRSKMDECQRELRPQQDQKEPQIEHGRITDLEQEQTEKTAANPETLFSLLSPVVFMDPAIGYSL